MFPYSWCARDGCAGTKRDRVGLVRRPCTTRVPSSMQLLQLRSASLELLYHSPALVCVERLVAARHIEQQLGRLEPSRKTRVEILGSLHHDLDAQAVHVPERPAPERRKADSEYRSYIAVSRRVNDSVAQAASGFFLT